jgi:hypothetical protein
MSASKKEKHRLKRKQKQAEARKRRNRSPLDAIRPGEGVLQVFINEGWKRHRQASIYTLREVGGRRVFAGFLVDEGVAGLKDAWVMPNITLAQFDDMLRMTAEQVAPVVSCDVDYARRLIAGSIRFATQYGFRLPRDLATALKVIDGVGDWRDADVSEFVPEFAGSMRDLRARCVGQPVDEFLARTDVSFVIDNSAPSLLDEEAEADAEFDGDEFDENDEFEAMAEAVDGFVDERLREVHQWCADTGQTPHPRLKEAQDFMLLAALEQLRAGVGLPDERDNEALSDVYEVRAHTAFRNQMLDVIPEPDRTELRKAMEQLQRFNAERPPVVEQTTADGDGVSDD